MILSFHPCFEADTNIIVAGRDPGRAELSAIRSAGAVILPQGCRESLFKMAVENCAHVFPDYHARFEHPGKTGQATLFNKVSAPFPQTFVYPNLASFSREAPEPAPTAPLPFPFVFKFDWGGEGQSVFLVKNAPELSQLLEITKQNECSGRTGFLIQAFIPHCNRSLRVVVINRKQTSYWRVQPEAAVFGTSLTSGARIDRETDPHLQAAAGQVVSRFCRQTGVNLAGFDLIFDPSEEEPKPVMLEINYFFGRTGLGGSDCFYNLLIPEIAAWIAGLKLT
jgi:ribosomal protein S6--L-glutamate ligase